MGEASDLPQRSSSPLKRRASDLDESDISSSQKDDVDMVAVPPSDPPEGGELVGLSSGHQRARSVDMLEIDDMPNAGASNNAMPARASYQQHQAVPKADPKNAVPPIDAQIQTITTLCQAANEHVAQEGDIRYLVSNRWLERVRERSSEAREKSKVEPKGDIGPIDNSDIVQTLITDYAGTQHVQLRRGLGEESFALFPEEAWDMVVSWYGLLPGSIPIRRVAHNSNPDKTGIPNVQYEFNPLVFTVHRLYADNNPLPISQLLKAQNPSPLVFVLSRSVRYYDFLKTAKEKSQIEMSRRVRVWRVPRLLPAAEPAAQPTNTVTPPSSRPSSPSSSGPSQPRGPQDSWKYFLLPVTDFTQLEKGNGRELMDDERGDITTNANYNGKMDLATAGLGEDQSIVLDEAVETAPFNFVSTYTNRTAGKTSTTLTRAGISQSQPNSGRNSPAPSGPVTRGRSQKSGKVPGTVGLSNLGNTCYMNSALQCVRSVEELTKYFLSGAAREELNYENPLGNNGQVAEAYHRLLLEIYKEPVPTSVAPRNFKSIIGKYAPSFSGYGQQDSQEFLGFLLDGLQEDLSRVKKKPYIEKPDSTDEMVNNPEAIREMAAKVWDITKKRDDSVVADLFTGMYKSTLVCPVCSKVSITFDPFTNLTLQLPVENAWRHKALYFPLNDAPHFIDIDMDKQGSIMALKQFVGQRVDVPAERLFAAEEFKGKFYKFYDNFAVASEEIGNNDNLAIYELEAKPTNWPPVHKSKKQKSMMSFNDSDEDVPEWDSPQAEKMVVPVFYRRPNHSKVQYNRKPWSLAQYPHFIVVTPEEAKNEEILKRKILEKVATFSSHPALSDDDEASESNADSVDPDIVITTGSDADSSGGSKVVATSIDGEDGLVDITMKEPNGVGESASKSGETEKRPLKKFNGRRPKFLDPTEFLRPELQNMFRLGYLSGKKEILPTGWNSIEEDKEYPALASRAPKGRQESPDSLDNANTSSESDASSVPQRQDDNFSGQTRMNEESSEEDEIAAPTIPRALPHRPAASRSGVSVGLSKGRFRKMKTYSKKNKHQPRRNFHDADMNDDDELNTADSGPLIRLGEAIMVDWEDDAFNAIYGTDPDDDNKSYNQFKDPPTLEDPLLAQKRKSRDQRRRNGITLDDCLNEFGKEEILSEQDTWYCPRCKEHRRASKKFELWKTPDILVMHLKRFSSSGFRRDKLDVMVDFPIEGLDLRSRVVENQEGKEEIYDLFAVDDHWGGLGGGHYTAFAKNFFDNEWYEYNDSAVSKRKDPKCVVTQSAYLLFYRRRSEEPLGGPKFKQIVRDYDNAPESGDDEVSESGEGQGPVGNTLRGSSGPLTGVGAAHRRPNHGSASNTDFVTTSTVESLPAYKAHEDSDDDVEPLLANDVEVNSGMQLQPSIEDEGIGMEDMNYNNISTYANLVNQGPTVTQMGGQWDWSQLGGNNRGHLVSGTGSDAASDIVQNNSSASSGSVRGRIEDFNNAEPDEEYVEQDEVPDVDEAAQLTTEDLHNLAFKSNSGFSTTQHLEFKTPDEDAESEEPATEIHVEDGDLGMKST